MISLFFGTICTTDSQRNTTGHLANALDNTINMNNHTTIRTLIAGCMLAGITVLASSCSESQVSSPQVSSPEEPASPNVIDSNSADSSSAAPDTANSAFNDISTGVEDNANTADSVGTDTTPSSDPIASSSATDVASNDTSPSADTDIASATNNNSATNADNSSITDASNTDDATPSNSNLPLADQSVADPMTQNTTMVMFNITVPAYQSNALLVRVAWGDEVSDAAWVGDEFWAVSTKYPTDTENPLTVTLFDNNGGVVLGTVSTVLRTGVNASESVDITAAQFDTAAWDDNNNGISNFDESLAGLDPQSVQTDTLAIRETFARSIRLGFHAQSLENRLPDERPFYELNAAVPQSFDPPYCQNTKSIDLDVGGNGNFLDTSRCVNTSYNDGFTQQGDRIRTAESVSWSGKSLSFNSEAGTQRETNFSTDTRQINDTTQRQTGQSDFNIREGNDRYNQIMSYDVTGHTRNNLRDQILRDSLLCEVTSGTITETWTGRSSSRVVNGTEITTLSKSASDDLWAVTVTTPDGELIDHYLAETVDAIFYCDFAAR